MRRFLFMSIPLLLLLAMPSTVGAQEQPESPAITSSLDQNNDGKVDKDEVADAIQSDARAGDVVEDVKDVVGEAGSLKNDLKDAKGNRTAMMMVIAGFLAALFKLLLSLVKVLAKNVPWFSGKEGKRIIKYSTLGLGALAGLCANLAFGVPMLESLLIFLSGPLSVAIHEYTKDSKETPASA